MKRAIIASPIAKLWLTGAIIAVTGSVVGSSRTAGAFPDPYYYLEADLVGEGGSGGRWYTGSMRDRYTCGVCHTTNTSLEDPLVAASSSSEGESGSSEDGADPFDESSSEDTGDPLPKLDTATPISVNITGLPEDGRVEPGERYELSIELDVEIERTAIVAEIVTPGGDAAGELQIVAKDAEDDGDVTEEELYLPVVQASADERQIYVLGYPNRGKARFTWKAPDSGPAWLFVQVAMADGSEGPAGDRVGEGVMELVFAGDEAQAAYDEAGAPKSGCASSDVSLGQGGLWRALGTASSRRRTR